jgi:hypothetical protein
MADINTTMAEKEHTLMRTHSTVDSMHEFIMLTCINKILLNIYIDKLEYCYITLSK